MITVGEISFIRSCDLEVIKSNGQHNKGSYHKGQYKVTFFRIEILYIQPQKRMATSASLCEGPILYYYLLPYARVTVIFTFSFSFYPLASSACWKEHDIYISNWM